MWGVYSLLWDTVDEDTDGKKCLELTVLIFFVKYPSSYRGLNLQTEKWIWNGLPKK